MMKFIVALFIFLASPVYAAVDYNSETKSVTISGVTSSFMTYSIKQTITENDVDTVFMYGPGGDFYEGLEIGRMLRDEGVRVIIPADKECASACALAAMGAESLFVDGVLLYHKPYVKAVDAHSTIDDIASMYGVAYLDMYAYVSEMGFDVSLARDIVENTNFCKLYVIKDDFSERVLADYCEE